MISGSSLPLWLESLKTNGKKNCMNFPKLMKQITWISPDLTGKSKNT